MHISKYSPKFFAQQKIDSYQSAQVVVPLFLNLFPSKSVVDIGCVVGAWLKAFADNGVSVLKGVDGEWVDKKDLLIPEANFVCHELENDFDFSEHFDTAVCLEVAEHLSIDRADTLIKFLTGLAPVVLFSAAIPGQDLPGQMHHINEQWPEYWAQKFLAEDFLPLDVLRDKIWMNQGVKYWYQQNILVYISRDFLAKNGQYQPMLVDPQKLSRVHPKTYKAILDFYKS